jgi:hypothetical protein
MMIPRPPQESCAQLLDRVFQQIQDRVKFPLKEAEGVIAQLKKCLAEKAISKADYDSAIAGILMDDQGSSVGPSRRE